MIIKETNELKILNFLYKHYSLKFNAEILSEKIKMPLSSVYSSLNILKKERFIVPLESNHNFFKLNIDLLPVRKLKEFLEACRFSKMPEKVQKQISNLLSKIRLMHKEVLFLVLFGSYASGDFTEDSDIDLLLVREDNTEYIDTSKWEYNGHLIQYALSEFNNHFIEGDDFVLSILLNHIIVYDPMLEFYSYLTKGIPNVSEKVIQEREQQLEKQRKTYLSYYKQNLPEEFVRNFIIFYIMKKRIEYLRKGIILGTNNEALTNIRKEEPDGYQLLLKFKDYEKSREYPSMKKLKQMVIAHAV